MNSSDMQFRTEKRELAISARQCGVYGGEYRWDQKTVSPGHTTCVLTTSLVMSLSDESLDTAVMNR